MEEDEVELDNDRLCRFRTGVQSFLKEQIK